MKIKMLSVVSLLLFAVAVAAQDNISALLPMPAKVETREGAKPFDLTRAAVTVNDFSENEYLLKELERVISFRTGVVLGNNKKCNSSIEILFSADKDSEGYTIDITRKKVVIEASTAAGVFYAIKTLDQLMLGDSRNSAEGKLAQVRIDDAPRFAYRGVMLDPARHFLPVDDVKSFIDQMAQYKYNVLQLHLTDDQGWRIEIKSHPKLTGVGAFRAAGGGDNGPDNGYYTQEQLRELVAYAAERNVEIIPELDIPGHSAAILAAYPQIGCTFRHGTVNSSNIGQVTNMMLCACSEEAYAIYEDIIKEVSEIFPSKGIHLGGDEAAVKDNWAKCDSCLALMKKQGYDNPSQLMIDFFGRMLDIVRRNGKEAVLWCELDNIWPPAHDYLFPYPKDVTLVTWRNALTPKCIELTRNSGHKLIMAPGEHTYLDYPQWKNDLPEYNNWGMPITSLETSYRLDPGYGLPAEEQSHIMGVMATMWAEAIKDINRVNYMFFPRGLAIAEAGWSRMEQRGWESFKERLLPNLTNLMKLGVSFRVPFEIYRKQ